ncbi:MAG TPA: hypothetical protein VMS17_03215 [Gemmataceae bacterium]|nr:hypothetical protein [Gemmataceae bacterium]
MSAMEADSLEQLRAIADQMRLLRAAPGASVFYELMSDSLVWSDEIPDLETGDVRAFHCLRYVFRYRTTLILGKPDTRYSDFWEEARSLFPDWPGFEGRRQSVELRPVYERFVEQARADIRELFPERIP